MNQNERVQLERETVHYHWVLRLQTGCKAIFSDGRRACLAFIYVAVMTALWLLRTPLFVWAGYDAPPFLQEPRFGQLYLAVSLAGLLGLILLFGTPIGWKSIQNDLRRIGLVNHIGEAPYPVTIQKDKTNPRVNVMEFEACGIPRSEWEDKREKVEAVLNVHVAKITQGKEKRRVLLYTVARGCALPSVLRWQDEFLSGKDFELALGESVLGPVTVNLAQIPHVLLGGSTGSGKSVLLKLLLMQCVRKGASVMIADFKGGVDFPNVWHEKCRMLFEKEDLLAYLTQLVEELERRKESFRSVGCSNIRQYNEHSEGTYHRIVFACDEVAELLDKNGLNRGEKELISKVENKLSVIARQGRAFGIHLILATQRPDATLLTGQIRNNLDCRICGRADSVLSQIILDNTDASDRIPKEAQGRFLLHGGTLFQGYLFDEETL